MPSKSPFFTVLSLVAIVALTVFATLAYLQAAPAAAPLAAAPAAVESASAGLSSSLSYYFLPGEAFSPDTSSYPFVKHQPTGCINYAPPQTTFFAPVYLPQGSQVISMTLFTYNPEITTTVSTAYLASNNGLGNLESSILVDSLPNDDDYQAVTSTVSSPYTVDNQAAGTYVAWVTGGSGSVPLALGLCGVRLAYYAPIGGTFLPFVTRP